MLHINFCASNDFNIKDFESIDAFIDAFLNPQPVWLDNIEQLEILLELLGMKNIESIELEGTPFVKYWDISNVKLPEYSENDYVHFYETWIDASKKGNTLNDYGSLMFLTGLSHQWNKLGFRFIVQEFV